MKVKKVSILHEYEKINHLFEHNTYHYKYKSLEFFYEYHLDAKERSFCICDEGKAIAVVPLFQLGARLFSPSEALRIFVENAFLGNPKLNHLIVAELKGRLASFKYLLDLDSRLILNFLKPKNYCSKLEGHIDLSLSLEQIFKSYKNSVRSDIRWGIENLEFEFIHKENFKSENIHEFMQFHISQAGKVTRSEKTWTIQGEMIEEGDAYIVNGYYNGELVAASLNFLGDEEVYYGVGVYDKKLMAKDRLPLTHAIVYKSLSFAKEMGSRRFSLGGMELSSEDGKIRSISKFKQSLCSDIMIKGYIENE